MPIALKSRTSHRLPTPTAGRVFFVHFPSSGTMVEDEYRGNKGLSEEIVKATVRIVLESIGYSTRVSTKGESGPDVEAHSLSDGKPCLLVEAKGEGSGPKVFHKNLCAALGQTLLRMGNEKTIYVIALPRHRSYLNLVRRIPRRVRESLNLEFWLVAPVEGIHDYEVGVLPSNRD